MSTNSYVREDDPELQTVKVQGLRTGEKTEMVPSREMSLAQILSDLVSLHPDKCVCDIFPNFIPWLLTLDNFTICTLLAAILFVFLTEANSI